MLVDHFLLCLGWCKFGYLTVSEIFPLEVRALASAFFYAIGTALGGVSAFGALIQTGVVQNVFYGDLIGAVLMAGAGVIEIFCAIKAERQSLESVARPLSHVDESGVAAWRSRVAMSYGASLKERHGRYGSAANRLHCRIYHIPANGVFASSLLTKSGESIK